MQSNSQRATHTAAQDQDIHTELTSIIICDMRNHNADRQEVSEQLQAVSGAKQWDKLAGGEGGVERSRRDNLKRGRRRD